jgi:monooxygenase
VQRAIHEFPKSGSRAPWRVRMNYPYDLLVLRYGRINDGALRFTRRWRSATAAPETTATSQTPAAT